MGRLIEVHDVNEFSRVAAIPDAAISADILASVLQLHEINELEPFLRQILFDPTETHHGPTEIADILTTHVHVHGHKKLAAFVLKGRSFPKVSSTKVAHQFLKLRTINGLGLMVFGAVGNIQDDAQRDFVQTALDADSDYLILNQHQIARLLIAYEKICPQDGKPFDDGGQCPNGHCLDAGISLDMNVSEKTRYMLTSQCDISHNGAKRYSAFVVLDRHYPKDLIKQIVRDATHSITNSTYYRSDLTKARWGKRPAHVVWLHVGCDIDDINNSNWICRTYWVDQRLDETMRPMPLKGDDTIEDIEILWNPQYEAIKEFTEDHQADKGKFLQALNEIRSPFLLLADDAVNLFQRYQQDTVNESDLISQMQNWQVAADDLYDKSGNIPFPPADCRDFDQSCQNLFATIHNMFLYFSERGLECWDKQNREWLMQDTISRYKEDVAVIEFEEKKIH